MAKDSTLIERYELLLLTAAAPARPNEVDPRYPYPASEGGWSFQGTSTRDLLAIKKRLRRFSSSETNLVIGSRIIKTTVDQNGSVSSFPLLDWKKGEPLPK